MDDSLFTGNDDLCKYFSMEMSKEFEMLMFGEIKFFVGLQIQQKKDGIYITQSIYIKEILKKFGMEDSRPVGTYMSIGHKLTKMMICANLFLRKRVMNLRFQCLGDQILHWLANSIEEG